MSNRAKGTRHEKAVADYLTGQGFTVERGFKKIAFLNGRPMAIGKDLFGAFDLLAIRQPSEVRFIQVTAGGNVAPRRSKALHVWPSAEIWEHLRAGVYRIHAMDGTTYVLDVRATE